MIDKKKTLPSFCTSNFDVLKSAVIFAKLNNLPILIESTSNQVNQFGGYTSLKPHQFYKKINGIAAKLNYRKKLINTTAKVLFENKLSDGSKYFGRDEYSNSVIVESKRDLVGKIFDVEIKKFNHNTLFGEIKFNNEISKGVAA